jgi:hypothetical protein
MKNPLMAPFSPANLGIGPWVWGFHRTTEIRVSCTPRLRRFTRLCLIPFKETTHLG